MGFQSRPLWEQYLGSLQCQRFSSTSFLSMYLTQETLQCFCLLAKACVWTDRIWETTAQNDCPLCPGEWHLGVLWPLVIVPVPGLPYPEYGPGASACPPYRWDPGTLRGASPHMTSSSSACSQLCKLLTPMESTAFHENEISALDISCHQLYFIFGNGPATLWFQRISKNFGV